jgi:hypothetical protein
MPSLRAAFSSTLVMEEADSSETSVLHHVASLNNGLPALTQFASRRIPFGLFTKYQSVLDKPLFGLLLYSFSSLRMRSHCSPLLTKYKYPLSMLQAVNLKTKEFGCVERGKGEHTDTVIVLSAIPKPWPLLWPDIPSLSTLHIIWRCHLLPFILEVFLTSLFHLWPHRTSRQSGWPSCFVFLQFRVQIYKTVYWVRHLCGFTKYSRTTLIRINLLAREFYI